MKRFVKIFSVLFILLFSGGYNAHALVGNQYPIPTGVELHPGLTKTEFKLCQYRRIFCGKAAVAIVAFAVLLIGIMIMESKLTWPILFITVVGVIIFANADKVAQVFGRQTWILLFEPNPLCDCTVL